MLSKNTSLTSDLPSKTPKKTESRLIPAVILISFLFGVAGSVFASFYIVPFYQKRGLDNVNSGGVNFVQVNEQSAVVDVVKRAAPAVVSIIISKDLNKVPGFSSSPFDLGPFSFDPFFQFRNPGEQSEPNVQVVGGGSGFIVTSDGLIVTNKHVVIDSAASYTVLTNDGKSFDAKVLSIDPVNDLALVKIEAKDLPTIPLGDSTDLEIGQKVIAIGNSLGHRNTVTTGVVSGIGRTITASGHGGSEQLEGVVQTDAAINPGNSGGPLLDIGGSVIGINTAIDSQGQLIGFAIPSEDIKKDIESFEKFGRIVKPFLGVRYVLVNETIQKENDLKVDYGALIVGGAGAAAVVEGSAADKAGLKEGDIILQVSSQRIDRDHSLAGALKNFDPGDTVKMRVLSEGEEKEITVILGETK
ncbi:MAG: trypsin-like peptidase domain-containing protein [Candidatus Doudnabacteria bacterium]|nr:trypsin-like peptidase domain-containing protein [Candidatus Doudnabacteria bacterium]